MLTKEDNIIIEGRPAKNICISAKPNKGKTKEVINQIKKIRDTGNILFISYGDSKEKIAKRMEEAVVQNKIHIIDNLGNKSLNLEKLKELIKQNEIKYLVIDELTAMIRYLQISNEEIDAFIKTIRHEGGTLIVTMERYLREEGVITYPKYIDYNGFEKIEL